MKNALVVGATGTLGRALARTLAARGCSLVPEWQTESRPDLNSPEAFDSIPADLDVAIYVAGVNAVSSIEDLSVEKWNEVLQLNLTSAFRFAQAIITRSGITKPRLVFISSIMSTHPYPYRSAYAAAKGGLESLTRSLAVESKGRYSTMAIRLGHIDTLMASTRANPHLLPTVKSLSPDNNLTTSTEVAELIVDLLPHAFLLNGSVLDADRGYTINRWPLPM